jgi:hypothetical protein
MPVMGYLAFPSSHVSLYVAVGSGYRIRFLDLAWYSMGVLREADMEGQFDTAIAALEQQLAEQNRTVLETKRSINLLLKMGGQNPRYTEEDVPSGGWVRPDQFYGKSLTAAAAEYLAMRKQACSPAEIVRALEAGGFDFDLHPWSKDDRVRPFAISLAKNTGSETGKFHKLKNGSFGLKAWYEEDFLKKADANAEAKAKGKSKKKKKVGSEPSKGTRSKGAAARPTKKPSVGKTAAPLAKGPSAKKAATTPPAKLKSSAKPGPPAADQMAQKESA